ncbi:hypothetical protein BYT27DRAFT_7097853 [Phlegmacium glaucopus]|nr:hypothetical protein BYT27DRAFT_7097853 [Phlegmacium glaucopus]
MARTADLKRKRTVDDDADDTPNKVARIESSINGQTILHILQTEDTHGLLDKHTPSLRSLLSKSTPISILRTAIASLPQQNNFSNLAISLLNQLSQTSSPQSNYALVQHLPSGDWWSSLTSLTSPSKLQSAKADLVAVLPSLPHENHLATLGSYSSKTLAQKKLHHSHRVVSTGAFLNYGLFSSFAPSFDQDGELVGRRELGQVLYYQEGKTRTRHAITKQSLQDPGSILETPQDPLQIHTFESELDLEPLLPPDEVKSLKAALNSLELENSVQKLLERNQRALERLEELQSQRLTNHPTSNAEEGSEEWDTAQAVLDSLTILASLRPRSSQDTHTLVPPPSVLYKLHRTLAVGSSPGWYGILPPGNITALRDDSTVKVRPGVVAPTPVPAAAAATATPVPNTFGSYPYAYTQQQQTYRPQPASYTPYKPGQTPSFYQGYVAQQQQTYYSPQTYATGTANQQPYGATTAQQPYAGYSSWYSYPAQGGAGSGRGTPQPVVAAPTTVPSTYGGFFNTSGAVGTRPPAVANTVVGNTPAATSYSQPTNPVPTLPTHLRPVNGSSTSYPQPHQNYYGSYPVK